MQCVRDTVIPVAHSQKFRCLDHRNCTIMRTVQQLLTVPWNEMTHLVYYVLADAVGITYARLDRQSDHAPCPIFSDELCPHPDVPYPPLLIRPNIEHEVDGVNPRKVRLHFVD